MTQSRPTYTRDSLHRALVHHGAHFNAPTENRSKWAIHTARIGVLMMTDREVHAYVVGLADAEHAAARKAS